jgi:hypothetical protein
VNGLDFLAIADSWNTNVRVSTKPGEHQGERLLDITQTPRETETEPHRMLNHGRWEAVTFVRNSRHWALPQANSHGLCRDCLALVLQHPDDIMGFQVRDENGSRRGDRSVVVRH